MFAPENEMNPSNQEGRETVERSSGSITIGVGDFGRFDNGNFGIVHAFSSAGVTEGVTEVFDPQSKALTGISLDGVALGSFFNKADAKNVTTVADLLTSSINGKISFSVLEQLLPKLATGLSESEGAALERQLPKAITKLRELGTILLAVTKAVGSLEPEASSKFNFEDAILEKVTDPVTGQTREKIVGHEQNNKLDVLANQLVMVAEKMATIANAIENIKDENIKQDEEIKSLSTSVTAIKNVATQLSKALRAA